MKIPFKEIPKLLADSFSELYLLGKEAIKQRTFPMDTYREAPTHFQFIDWTTEDNHGLIEYSFQNTQIGRLLLANTPKGLCFLGFACNGEAEAKADCIRRFPKQTTMERFSEFQKTAIDYCNGHQNQIVPLHLKGTTFQIEIWKKLVRIPEGCLSTYGSLSNHPGGAQATGSAVGANPVSYIVPCHRIVKNDGDIQGYHWGTNIKKQLLAYELQIYLP